MIVPRGKMPVVAVIGAGHAGRAAVARLSGAGVSVVVFDEAAIEPIPGAPTAELHPFALVWGLFPEHIVGYLASADRAALLEADAVIIATGATSRAVPFPGWTLPGVLPAADLEAEGMDRLAAHSVALVGVGDELARVRDRLTSSNTSIAATIDLRQHPGSAHEAIRSIAAHGTIEVTGIMIGDGDEQQAYDCDTVCVAFGANPTTELARMVECDVAYRPERGGWHVTHDEGLRASQPGYYVAGACTGRTGAMAARAMGTQAALSVLDDFGLSAEASSAPEQRPQLATVDSGADERASLDAANELAGRVTPAMVLCPCEGVVAARIDEALDLGARTLNDVKRYTRCCMGTCQGRICASIIAGYAERRAGITPEQFGQLTARPPVRPIALSAMAALDE